MVLLAVLADGNVGAVVGTAGTLTLPAEEGTLLAIVRRDRAADEDGPVLVIMCDAGRRSETAQILRRNRIPADEAADSAEAMARIGSGAVSLVLFDLTLPGAEGWRCSTLSVTAGPGGRSRW